MRRRRLPTRAAVKDYRRRQEIMRQRWGGPVQWGRPLSEAEAAAYRETIRRAVRGIANHGRQS